VVICRAISSSLVDIKYRHWHIYHQWTFLSQFQLCKKSAAVQKFKKKNRNFLKIGADFQIKKQTGSLYSFITIKLKLLTYRSIISEETVLGKLTE